LQVKHIYDDYVDFLRDAYNPDTLWNLMCKTQLSIDYLGNIYDCDFNQVEWVPAIWKKGKQLTLKDITAQDSLDIIKNIMVRDYCFWCTAWAWSSCWWALS
jgi:MoaA/NifB/PqqE/SkfB family radical SAM enzyme